MRRRRGGIDTVDYNRDYNILDIVDYILDNRVKSPSKDVCRSSLCKKFFVIVSSI